MTAPWEVWARKYVAGDWTIDNEKFNGGTRYIRADMLCGNCASLDYDRNGIRYCKKRALRVGESEPACMAFVPKKVRP